MTIENAMNHVTVGDTNSVAEARKTAIKCLMACDKLMNMKRKPGNDEYNKALDDMYVILSEVEV